MRVGRDGRVVAVGRDLRATAALQQRLVDAQQSMERDYARLRHVETRYRLLFQMTSEAVLIVDAASHKVVEANPAAAQLLGDAAKPWSADLPGRLRGAEVPRPCQALLAGVRATGRPDDVRARALPKAAGSASSPPPCSGRRAPPSSSSARPGRGRCRRIGPGAESTPGCSSSWRARPTASWSPAWTAGS